jgi:hypothetical protein
MRRSIEVDMSEEAFDRRLRDVGQLYKLWLVLREARDIGRREDLLRAEREAAARDAEADERAGRDEGGA